MPDTYVGAGHARRSVSLAGYQGREPLPSCDERYRIPSGE